MVWQDTLKRVAWTFVQAFLATLLILAPGILNAPNMDEAKALGLAALVAAIAAGLSAIKNILLPPANPAR